MARKLPLKVVQFSNPLIASPEDANSLPYLDYGRMMENLLRWAPPNSGLIFDDVVRAVETIQPITAAMLAEEDHVILSEDQWKTLNDKLNVFPFGVADPVIVEFGLAIRNAPELGTDGQRSPVALATARGIAD